MVKWLTNNLLVSLVKQTELSQYIQTYFHWLSAAKYTIHKRDSKLEEQLGVREIHNWLKHLNFIMIGRDPWI